MFDIALNWLVICAIVLLVLAPGYLLWLWWSSRIGTRRAVPGTSHPPDLGSGDHGARDAAVAVVLAVRDEAHWIEEKLRDLAALETPAGGLSFWIVDGDSTDGTAELVARWAESDDRFRLLRAPVGDKIAQVNLALRAVRAPWVLVTDADARLAPDTVTALLEAADDDPRLGVIGVPIRPGASHPLERLHWRLLNWSRRAEAARGSAAIVAAPCYLFQRELLAKGFPADVVADDVHVALACAAAGRRVGFVERAALELRAPCTLGALFRHKLRKAAAYQREVVRFLPRLVHFGSPSRAIFLWRAAQLLIFPLAVATAVAAFSAWAVFAETASVLAAAAALTAPLVLDLVLAVARRRPARLVQLALLGLLLAGVLLVALASLPFVRRSACYPKIAEALPARGTTS